MLKIISNEWLPKPHTHFFPDWRQRLHRNLNRPSTGKWEPLSEERGYDIYMINDDYIMHPEMVAIIKNISE